MNLIYFEIDEYNYPPIEPFKTWIRNGQFRNKNWIAANKLSVIETAQAGTANFCVTAPKEWVKKNCPSLLREDMFFCPLPEDKNICYSRYDIKFLNYNEGYKYV